MIVDKGVTLTRPLIMRLSFYCVLEVGIEDPDEPKDPETPHFIGLLPKSKSIERVSDVPV